METVIKAPLTAFSDVNQLIHSCQHGFMKGKSCLTNLLESSEIWTKALDDEYGLVNLEKSDVRGSSRIGTGPNTVSGLH